MADLKLQSLVKRYDDVETIHKVSADINSGEFIVLIGPSGCGKSTLLRMIAGLEEVTSGDIYIEGENVTNVVAAKRGIAMVFQSYALYPHMNVRENLSFGLKNLKHEQSYIDEKIQYAVETLQLSQYLDRMPSQLSGGQRQRIAIGRAIVRDPKIFLFDEPLSNLDTELRVQMRHEIIKLHKKLGNTMIYVTHDQVEAMTMADRIIVLDNGNIAQIGAPLELYNNPQTLFTASFIGSPKINLLKGVVKSNTDGQIQVDLENKQTISIHKQVNSLSAGDTITLGIRPEHINNQSVTNSITFNFTLDEIECLGDSTLIYAQLDGGADAESIDVRIKLQGQHSYVSETKATFQVASEHVLIFNENGQNTTYDN